MSAPPKQEKSATLKSYTRESVGHQLQPGPNREIASDKSAALENFAPTGIIASRLRFRDFASAAETETTFPRPQSGGRLAICL
jgi:hypothetical protein